MQITRLRASEFPQLLKEITDPPKELYLRGTFPQTEKYLAVVGSRKFSPYGKDVCEKLIEGLAGHDITIVSGLALGIDALAHRAALRAKLPTIAIPGSGVSDEVLYPSSNRSLAHMILESGGAVLSEFDPTFRATTWSFPQRNRIMAGLSHAILVIEATEKSGTLITARLATEYNRDVFTVPGSIFQTSSYGPHMLIRNGATPICSSNDILRAFGMETEAPAAPNLADLSEDEQKVVALLEHPVPKDDLIQALALPVSEVNVLLMSMELKGLIQERMGEVHLT